MRCLHQAPTDATMHTRACAIPGIAHFVPGVGAQARDHDQAQSHNGLAGRAVAEHGFDHSSELGQVFVQDDPNHIQVDGKVLVHHHVAQAHHPTPIDVAVACPQLLGNVACRLANDLQVAYDGVRDEIVGP